MLYREDLASMSANALQRRLTPLGTLVLKLYVNTIQSPVHYYQIIRKNFFYRHRGLNPRRTFCAMIFQLIFQPYYLVVIAKTESSIRNKEIRNQLLLHVLYLSDDRVRLKFSESAVNMLYANGQQSRVQLKIQKLRSSRNVAFVPILV